MHVIYGNAQYFEYLVWQFATSLLTYTASISVPSRCPVIVLLKGSYLYPLEVSGGYSGLAFAMPPPHVDFQR